VVDDAEVDDDVVGLGGRRQSALQVRVREREAVADGAGADVAEAPLDHLHGARAEVEQPLGDVAAAAADVEHAATRGRRHRRSWRGSQPIRRSVHSS